MQESFDTLVQQQPHFFHISPLTEDCVRDVKNLEIECGLSPWTIADYMKEMERSDSITAAAKNNDEVIGFIVARLRVFSDGPARKNGEIEIYNIAVKGAFRRYGIGRALLNYLLQTSLAREASRVWLEVRESNNMALKFYQKNGFKRAYVRKGFFSSPVENAIVMSLQIPSGK